MNVIEENTSKIERLEVSDEFTVAFGQGDDHIKANVRLLENIDQYTALTVITKLHSQGRNMFYREKGKLQIWAGDETLRITEKEN